MKPILILDVDGVIFDSNTVKENNIKQATLEYVDKKITQDFVRYFTKNNGVPREIKICNYFKNELLTKNILDKYNALNKKSLEHIEFTKEAFVTLQNLSGKYRLVALSGGDINELVNLFKIKKIDLFFDKVCGGPNTKSENLKKLKLEDVCCFVGDSKIDFEVATEFKIPFIFMKTYTQFNDWENYFKSKGITPVINYLYEIFQINLINK